MKLFFIILTATLAAILIGAVLIDDTQRARDLDRQLEKSRQEETARAIRYSERR